MFSSSAGKKPATCYIVMRVDNGAFHRVDTPGDSFRCDGRYYYVR